MQSGRQNHTQHNSALSQTSDTGINCTADYYGLAIDIGRQKLYYTDVVWRGVRKLGELSTDGTGHSVLIAVNDSRPRAVVIDDVNRFDFETPFCISICMIW